MNRSRVRRSVRIPSVSTNKLQTKDFQYVKGMNTNSSNDDVDNDQWRYISDAREIEIGKWETRNGSTFLSIPIGEAVNVQETSTTGATDETFNSTNWIAQKLTAASTGRLTAVELRLKNTASASGTIVVAVYDDDAGEPGTELVRSTIASGDVTGSYTYVKARTITCPDITNGVDYWVIAYVQDGGQNSYSISTTTTSTDGLTSSSSGQSWTAETFSFNVKLSTATASGTLGAFRVVRQNGTTTTFMAHGNTLYTVNESTGVTTAVDTGLNVSTTYVRFAFVNDVLYYVTGLQKPRKYDFSAASEVTTALENASHIIEHKGLLFYISSDDPNKAYFSNFGAYDTYTSTDFLYIPAPKTGDPVKAFARLNGILYFLTRNNKYALFGAENATFRLDNAIGQKGTFSQESVAYDQNFVFLASDDGIYQFNGAEEKNIAKDVLEWWTALSNKDKTTLELHDNRLYVYYTPNGQGQNSKCRVYNYLYGIWESEDTRTYINRTYTQYDQDKYFVQGSNRVGMLMLGETADYNNLGEPLHYKLWTRYDHFDAPAQFKRMPTYRPHFDTVSGNYSVQVGYATDYSDSPTFTNVSLQGDGPTFDSGETFDSGVTFGGTQQVNPMDGGVVIPGEWRRLQIRYEHEAAREPVSFDGHVGTIEVQRII